jgi:hypothetical protein
VSPTTIGGHSFTIAGSVHPVGPGWLVVAAKMRGGSFVPDLPRVFPDLARAIEGRPRFDVVGVNVAVGDPALAKSGNRACDLACKELLGSNPKSLRKQAYDESLKAVMKQRRREAVETIGSRHQRTAFEYLPELSLFQATGGAVGSLDGDEQLTLALEALSTLPGVDRILEAELEGVSKIDLIRAALGLWTARRVIARIAVRIPVVPTLSHGFRVEILR